MRRIRCRFVVPGLVLIFMGAHVAIADVPPSLQVELSKSDDTVAVTEESGRTVIAVTSSAGIGRMTVTSKEGRWPRDMTLRIRYRNSKPFRTLEGFEMTSSRLQVRSRSADAGKAPFFLAGDDGRFSRDDLNPTGWLRMEFKSHGDDLDVIFPAELWRDEKKVQIQWIDFYR